MNRNMIKLNIVLWAIVAIVALGALTSFSSNRWLSLSIFGNPFSGISYGNEHTVLDEAISGEITDLQIDWISDVDLIPDPSMSSGARIVVTSTAKDDSDSAKIDYKLNNGNLHVELKTKKYLNFGSHYIDALHLELYVPAKEYRSLRLNTVSGNANIADLSCDTAILNNTSGDVFSDRFAAGSFDLHTVSGNIRGQGVNIGDLAFNSTSGNAKLQGSLTKVHSGTVSGNINIDSAEMLRSFSADTVSGNISVTVPENDGFSLNFDTVSGDLKSDFPLLVSGGSKHIYQDGGASFSVNSISGNMKIYKQ